MAPQADPVVRRPADPRRPTSWARDNRLICALGTRDGSMVPAAQMERYEPVAEVSTWPRTAPDIDLGTGGRGHSPLNWAGSTSDASRFVKGLATVVSVGVERRCDGPCLPRSISRFAMKGASTEEVHGWDRPRRHGVSATT